jgi:hypothetical protein
MKKKTTKKLVLARETLRTLTGSRLAGVLGGTDSNDCGTTSTNNCPYTADLTCVEPTDTTCGGTTVIVIEPQTRNC